MKFLKSLEKRADIWALLGIIVIFFFLRLPSLIEPYWYGDEGVYEVIGKALRDGRTLYSEIWDNKPPLLYILYALFDADQFSIRFFSFIVGIATVVLFYAVAKKLIQNYRLTIFLTVLFTLLFGTPFVEGNIANAENFMMVLILAASYLIISLIGQEKERKVDLWFFSLSDKTRILQIAGLLLGVAFLFKIVAIFDFLALATFLFFFHFPRRNQLFPLRIQYLVQLPIFQFFVFFLLPLFITSVYFLLQGVLTDFFSALLFSNISYVGYRNTFLFPQGLLFFKTLTLLGFVIFLHRKRFSLPHGTIFIFLWFSFSLFNAFFSQRPYTHYLLVLLPSFLLLLGLLLTNEVKKKRPYVLYCLLSLLLIVAVFRPKSLIYVVKYYNNFFSFITNKKDVHSYQTFFDRDTLRDYEVAFFLKAHTETRDNIFVWGNSPQIYTLSNKLPPGKFIVAYHIAGNKKAVEATKKDLDRAKPRFIALLPDSKEIPFDLSYYRYRLSIQDTDIYERIF